MTPKLITKDFDSNTGMVPTLPDQGYHGYYIFNNQNILVAFIMGFFFPLVIFYKSSWNFDEDILFLLSCKGLVQAFFNKRILVEDQSRTRPSKYRDTYQIKKDKNTKHYQHSCSSRNVL